MSFPPYKICTFNIQHFNTTNPKGHPIPRIETIAKMIDKNMFDVIAIQEIVRTEVIKKILEYLKYLPSNSICKWKGVSKFSGKTGEGGECYGFIWNSERLEQLGKEDVDNTPRTLRPPLYIRFRPVDTKTDFEFRFLNIHIRFSNNKRFDSEEYQKTLEGNEDLIEEEKELKNQDLGTVEARRAEFDSLINWYNKKMCPTAEKQKYGKQVYAIILGDYNLCLDGSPKLHSDTFQGNGTRDCIVINKCSMNQISLKTTGIDKTTLRTVPEDIKEKIEQNQSISLEDENRYPSKWSHNYDHFTYNTKQMGDAEYKNGRSTHPDLGIEPRWKQVYDYRRKFSDHIPLVYSFDISKKKVEILNIIN